MNSLRAALLFGSITIAACVAAASCGGDNNGNLDGSVDGTTGDGGGGDAVVGNEGGWNGDGGCSPLGLGCATNGECCSSNCLNNACQPPTCTSDNQPCTTNTQCCGGTCGANNTCTPLSNNCRTLGNACTTGGQCCSLFCENGICAQPSYCGQNGDICTQGSDCCGGLCVKQANSAFGLCGQPPQGGAQCSQVDGVLCGGTGADGGVIWTDGGLPLCGGACCSRDCAPWGPTSVLICQPASGCHPVGDLCGKDSDCCGGFGTNPQQTCNKANANDPVGTCGNPTGCKPNGDICRLKTNQCNATDNCCSGNVQQFDTCKQDSLGVPRCSYAGDAGCVPAGADAGCASSADCCNLNPCVPNPQGTPPFTCYPQNCVPVTGACTNDADCCKGGHCYIQSGQSSGTCTGLVDGGAPDSGSPCSLYGQLCTTSGDCCNNIPCTNGRCEVPQPN